MIKIILVDDEAAVRQGLRMMLGLEPDLTVIGEASSGAAAIELVPDLVPDVVVMDIEMPGIDGISATQALRTVAPHCAVVVLTLFDDSTTRSRVQAAGAQAFVSKIDAAEALTPAIRRAAEAGEFGL